MNKYLHVVISLKGQEDRPMFLYGDMTEKEFRKKFLQPYKLGKGVLKDGAIITLSEVTGVVVVETDAPKDKVLEKLQRDSMKRMEELNRNSDLFFVGLGDGNNDEDIAHAGTVVTDKYISAPPGNGTWMSRVSSILHNPWVLALGVPALLALFAYIGSLL